MDSEIGLYSSKRYPRYMQCLEAFSFNNWVRDQENARNPNAITPERYFERVIKLHALFGARIVITSITPVGSTVLLSLFKKADFVDFLKKFPSFLELKCNFNRDIDDNDEQHLIVNRVLAGLKRVLDPDWTSSLFPELPQDLGTRLIKTVAESILKPTEGYSSLDLRVAQESLQSSLAPFKSRQGVSPRHLELLQAVPDILHHFINTYDARVSRTKNGYQQPTVYELVKKVRERGTLNTYEPDMTRVLEFVDQRCGSDASFSRIITTTESAQDLNEEEKRKLLATACYAYNHQLVEAVGDCFGSYIQLREGAPIGLHTHHFHSAVLRSYEPEQNKLLGLKVSGTSRFGFNLDLISWKHIKEVMDSDDIARTAFFFQEHLHDIRRDDNAAIYDLNSHAKNLAEYFVKHGVPIGPRAWWLWIIGGVGGVVAVVVGGQLSGSTAGAIFQWISSAVVVKELTAQGVHQHAKYVTAEMLQNAAKDEFLSQ